VPDPEMTGFVDLQIVQAAARRLRNAIGSQGMFCVELRRLAPRRGRPVSSAVDNVRVILSDGEEFD